MSVWTVLAGGLGEDAGVARGTAVVVVVEVGEDVLLGFPTRSHSIDPGREGILAVARARARPTLMEADVAPAGGRLVRRHRTATIGPAQRCPMLLEKLQHVGREPALVAWLDRDARPRREGRQGLFQALRLDG